MSSSIPIDIPLPRVMTAGDSTTVNVMDFDHPSPDWTMQLSILSPTPAILAGTAGVGGSFDLALDSAFTGAIAPGQYSTALIFSSAGKRETRTGPILYLLPDPLSPITPTWEMTTLVMCQTAIQKIGKSPNSQVTINGQSYTKANINNLLDLMNRLINTVANQLRAMGRPTGAVGPRKIITRFRP